MEQGLTVVKSNELIEASYRFTLTEQRLVLFCIAQMDSMGSYSKKDEFYVKAKDFQAFFGLKGESVYRDLKAAEESLFNRKFNYINQETKRVRKTRWISAVEYDGEEGLVLQFSPDVLPFITQIKSNYTQYRLQSISSLNSIHAIRIYELCLQYLKIGERKLAVDELKTMLGIEDQYSIFKQFNQWVLKPSIDQINKHTDIRIQVEPVRKLRKIVALKFKIKSKQPTKHKASEQKTNSTFKKLRETLEENYIH